MGTGMVSALPDRGGREANRYERLRQRRRTQQAEVKKRTGEYKASETRQLRNLQPPADHGRDFKLNRQIRPPARLSPPDSLNCRLVGKIQYPPFWEYMGACVTTSGVSYVSVEAGNFSRILAFDVSDPSNISQLGFVGTGIDWIYVLAKSGNYLYAVGNERLEIYDARNPSAMVKVSALTFPGPYITDVVVRDSFAYLGDEDGVRIVNVANPTAPFTVGYTPVDDGCWQLAVQGDYLYGVNDEKMFVIDISNVSAPVARGQLEVEGLWDIAAQGDFAFACGEEYSLVIDCSNPDVPLVVWTGEVEGYMEELSGNLLYILGSEWLIVYNVGNPSNPIRMGMYGEIEPPEECDGLSVVGTTAYATGACLYVIDCSDFGPPVIGQCGDWYSDAVWVRDTFAYLATSDGMKIVNIAVPSNPVLKASCPDVGWSRSVVVRDTLAVVGNEAGMLWTVNVRNPLAPAVIGVATLLGKVVGLSVRDSLVFAACDYNGLQIVNIRNPAAPLVVGSYYPGSDVRGVWVTDTLAYLANGWAPMEIVNVKDPANPFSVVTCASVGAYAVRVVGNRAYAAGYHRIMGKACFFVLDVSNPVQPQIFGELRARGRKVFVRDTLAFLSAYTGINVVNVAQPQSMSVIGTAGVDANDCWVGSRYGYVATDHGLKVVDFANPTGGIKLIGRYAPEEVANQIYAVALTGDYAVLTSDSGLQVISVANPASPTPVGTYQSVYYWSLDVKGSLVYCVGWSGFAIYDITNPASPARRGGYSGSFSAVKVDGDFAYITPIYAENGLAILDVRNPDAPQLVGACPLTNGPNTVNPWALAKVGDTVLVLGDDGSYYQSCLCVVDVSNPANPTQVAVAQIDESWSYRTGIAAKGNLCYLALHNLGLLIYDISSPTGPSLVGRYTDTLIYATDVALDGNYAIVTSSGYGLHVINVTSPVTPTLYGWYHPGYCDYHRLVAHDGLAYVADEEMANFSIIRYRPERIAGWQRLADLPAGPKNKNVKNGGCLAYKPDYLGDHVYALKGNGRCEFYRYNVFSNTWETKESIPAIGRSGKKKVVKKGGAIAAYFREPCLSPPGWRCCCCVPAIKGNNTLEFWLYDPQLSGTGVYPWSQLPDVPQGSKALKEGTGLVRLPVNDTPCVFLLKGSGTNEFYCFNHYAGSWRTMTPAPLGVSGKPYKSGSCLTTDGTNTIYALKGNYNEFYAYNIATGIWTTKASLPLVNSAGNKKKAKDGAALAWSQDRVYALKGNNTAELWQYNPTKDTWVQLTNMPVGGGKKVKGGGALTAMPDALFALKGNNTLEFWGFGISSLLADAGGTAAAGSSGAALKPELLLGANPVGEQIRIMLQLPQAGAVSLRLYDMTGRLAARLAQGWYPAGTVQVTIATQNLSKGVYLLRLSTAAGEIERKLVVIR